MVVLTNTERLSESLLYIQIQNVGEKEKQYNILYAANRAFSESETACADIQVFVLLLTGKLITNDLIYFFYFAYLSLIFASFG